jgi:hypothetical protein
LVNTIVAVVVGVGVRARDVVRVGVIVKVGVKVRVGVRVRVVTYQYNQPLNSLCLTN